MKRFATLFLALAIFLAFYTAIAQEETATPEPVTEVPVVTDPPIEIPTEAPEEAPTIPAVEIPPSEAPDTVTEVPPVESTPIEAPTEASTEAPAEPVVEATVEFQPTTEVFETPLSIPETTSTVVSPTLAPYPPEYAALFEAVENGGHARVIVGLNVPTNSGRSDADQMSSSRSIQNQLLRNLPRSGVRVTNEFETIPFVALEVNEATLRDLIFDPHVASIEEDKLSAPVDNEGTVSSNRAARLTQSTNIIDAPEAWALGYDGRGWAVAILGTGVAKNHPMLRGKVVSEACYSSNYIDRWTEATSLCPGRVSASTAVNSGLPCNLPRCEWGTGG